MKNLFVLSRVYNHATAKKAQLKYKKLRLCDMCAQDVHNLTKKAQMRQ